MQAQFQPAAAGLSPRGQVQPRPRTQLYAILDQLVEVREEFNLPSKAISILRALDPPRAGSSARWHPLPKRSP